MKHQLSIANTTLAFGALLFFSACFEQPETKPASRPVQTIVITDPITTDSRSFSGIAVSAIDTELSFKVAGEIAEFPVILGQRLEENELIARIDATDYELQRAQAKANKALTEAQYLNAETEYNRVRQLWENDNLSESDLQRAKAARDSAKAQMEAAEKQLALTQQRVVYCSLYAPRDGVIAAKRVELNEVLRSGQSVVSFVSFDDTRFQVGVPEALIGKVRIGMPATVRIDAFPEETFTASVIEKGVIVGQSSTYPITLSLSAGETTLAPGMVGRATIDFPLNASPLIFSVPSAALVGRLDERYVWTVDSSNGRVSKKAVQVVELTEDQALIKQGLEPGDIVVVRGAHRIEEGMTVEILPHQSN